MRKRLLASGIVATAVIAAGAAYLFGFASDPPRPNVILIVLDTFRADRLAIYGNTQGLTPFLDQWAAKSTVYERAYAASPWTAPSVASLLLAQYPSEHQIIRMTSVLPESERSLTEVLRDTGFRTGGFSGNEQISAKTGFRQGFEAFKLLIGASGLHGDAQQLNQAALQWLAQRDDAHRPFFLYLQYMDTHSPYRVHPGLTAPRAAELQASDANLNERLNNGSLAAAFGNPDPWQFNPTETQRLMDLYDADVRYLDGRVGAFLGSLEQRGLLQRTLVIITADHGEQLGEHGLFSHGVSLYESAIRVPLIVRYPGQSRPQRFPTPVELAGLAPALLEYLRISRPAEFHTRAMAFGEGVPHSGAAGQIFSEVLKSHPQDFRLHRYALIDGTHKLLVTETGTYLYDDLTSDLQENRQLAAAPFGEQLLQSLNRITSTLSVPSRPRQEAVIDDESRERLRSLGYAN